MDEVWGDGVASTVLLVLIVVEEAVEEGACEVAVAGVDDEAGTLVDHENILVLIDDVEGYGLGEHLEVVRRLWEEDADLVTGLDLVVGLGLFAVHEDAACLGGSLDFVARDAFETHEEVFVEAQHGLAFVDKDMMVLIERSIFF